MTPWTSTDFWIVAAAALAGMASALPGTLLLLRRMSMMGDAISHAVLPGIAIAFAVSHARSGPWMLAGAIAAGVLSAVLTQLLHEKGQVEEGASMGVVFTLMFAAGLVLMETPLVSRHVDLDLDCVLFGAVELVPLEPAADWWPGVPAPVARLVVVFLVNILGIAILYKEWKLSSFDPELARSLGFRPGLLHHILMVMTAVTTVYCFEIVGSILVIAMLIVPAACARFLTDRLLPTLVLSVFLALVFAVTGHLAAMEVPVWFGFEDTSSAGSMSAVGGIFFLLCVAFAPRYGHFHRQLHRMRLRRRILAEDVLAALYRREELSADDAALPCLPVHARQVLPHLRRIGYVAGGSMPALTHNGFLAGAELLRRHRLWEGWLHEHTATPLEHLHLSAETLEHVTPPALRERLAEEVADSKTDPTGRRIPGGELVGGETLHSEAAGGSASSPGSSSMEM